MLSIWYEIGHENLSQFHDDKRPKRNPPFTPAHVGDNVHRVWCIGNAVPIIPKPSSKPQVDFLMRITDVLAQAT